MVVRLEPWPPEGELAAVAESRADDCRWRLGGLRRTPQGDHDGELGGRLGKLFVGN